ncbi:MAG: UPF0175 family protein [Caldilineaceae bacterium]|nr:UPF0175 family protein [Caldilinea sp.]MCB0137375.1 UPF0175 family protein [Caldilineaceae bacterium]
MGIVLEVPDSVAQAIRLPEKRMQAGLLLELAVALYAQELLSFGKACELAGVSRRDFATTLSMRDVPRHYGAEELEDDLGYARGQ